MNKQFAIASLFDAAYITVYDDATGIECGRIYGNGKQHLAHHFALNRKALCPTLALARQFIKTGRLPKRCAFHNDHEKQPKSFNIILRSEHQWKILGTRPTEGEARKLRNQEAQKYSSALSVEVMPVY